jgi:MFS family permease
MLLRDQSEQARSCWKLRDFRALWVAATCSAIGDRIVLVVLAIFVQQLTHSAGAVGAVIAANRLPFVALLLLGGVVGDRLSPARVLLASDLARCVLHGTLAALILTDQIELWQILVIEALFGSAEAFGRPSTQALLPETVPPRSIQSGAALVELTTNGANLLGPVIATVLLLGAGAGWAFGIDAGTFMLSALCVAQIKVRKVPLAIPRGLGGDLRAGWREVRRRRWLLGTIAASTVLLLAGTAPFLALGPLAARLGYGSTAVYGLLWIAIGAGLIGGGLLALRLRPRQPLLAAFGALCPWPVLLAGFATGLALPLLLLVAVATGVGFTLFDVWWRTTLAEQIPAQALARVSSWDHLGSLALMPVGLLLAGPLAQMIGAQAVLLAGGGIILLVIAGGLASPFIRTVRQPRLARVS